LISVTLPSRLHSSEVTSISLSLLGEFVNSHLPEESKEATISFVAEFFAPEILTEPDKGRPPLIINFVHFLSVILLFPESHFLELLNAVFEEFIFFYLGYQFKFFE